MLTRLGACTIVHWQLRLQATKHRNIMRFLHTVESRFEVFTGHKPEYAILSHTWGESEASYQQMLDIHARANTCTDSVPGQSGPFLGVQNIFAFCLKARMNGFELGRVDTCCIDKSS